MAERYTQITQNDFSEGSNPSALTLNDLLRRYDKNTAVHVQRVASMAAELMKDAELSPGDYKELLDTALLHDVVEDTEVTWQDVARTYDYDVNMTQNVFLLTRTDDISYNDYIDRLCKQGSRTALIVKVADIVDHLSPANIQGLTESKQKRYIKALNTIINELRNREAR